MKRILFNILLFAATAHAQEALDFFPGGTYDPKIPPPKSVLGYSIGERFTEYAALNAYFDKLSAASDRIRHIAYGETNEHRILQAFIIGTPENLARLDEIKQANIQLTDPKALQSNADAERDILRPNSTGPPRAASRKRFLSRLRRSATPFSMTSLRGHSPSLPDSKRGQANPSSPQAA